MELLTNEVVLVLITAACTLVTTLAGMLIQRQFTISDRKLEICLRREDELEAEERAAASVRLKRAEERSDQARLELLRLFSEVEPEFGIFAILQEVPLQEQLAGPADVLVDMTPRLDAAPRLAPLQPKLSPTLAHRAELHLAQLADRNERWLLAACADIVTHYRAFDTYHGNNLLVQAMVAGSCANYAVQVLGASLRCEPLPPPPRVLIVRLPAEPGTPALRRRRPAEWDTDRCAIEGQYEAASVEVVISAVSDRQLA